MIGAIASHYVDAGPATATLTIGAGKVASTLTSFPVRVDLTHMTTSWWSDVTSDGGNIRVKASGAVIPFDLVTIDTSAKTGELFFKAPSLTTSANAFTIDKSGSGLLAVTDTNGRNNVWVDYETVGIFHSAANRTGKTADLVLVGTGALSGGLLVCGSGGNGYYTGLPKLTTWTMGLAAIPGDQAQRAVLSYSELTTTDASRATLLARTATWNLWNSTNAFLASGVAVNTGVRARLHHTQATSTNRKIYVNGVVKASATAAQRPGGTGGTLFVGAEDTSYAERSNGSLGYVYLRNGELSADWLAAEYTSWETPASFYTVT